ncbi:MAG: PAS domain-containing sensor histidine kinase [Sphingomonadales bacterium]|nr:MAG: PAS domain-containing sensor histidine kinase [Sphingomonadales bacterium]
MGDSQPNADSQLAAFVFAVVLLDPAGHIVAANPAAEDLLGRSAQRLIGAKLADVATLGDPRVEVQLDTPDAPLVARDIALATAGGSRRVNLTSSPLHGHPGWRAITLSEAGYSSDEGEGMELRAPAILAHEIKNPLAAIRGAGQLLARRLEAKDKPLADIIASEVDRIATLVDRMQQLGSAAKATPGTCNLHEAIRSALVSVRAARDDAVELAEAFDPSLPAVAADADALQQVLINLVSNGCDACADAEYPRVEVRTRFVSGLVYNVIRLGKATRLPVEIVVADNGPGIAPELRDHVFEPFVTGKTHGQGLGLALVRKLVRDMGGRIAHERDDKAGLTIFRINLAVAA